AEFATHKKEHLSLSSCGLSLWAAEATLWAVPCCSRCVVEGDNRGRFRWVNDGPRLIEHSFQ
ncbi:MAG: hypothetical protein ACI9X4_002110, partial [Glaciecola sp.]